MTMPVGQLTTTTRFKIVRSGPRGLERFVKTVVQIAMLHPTNGMAQD